MSSRVVTAAKEESVSNWVTISENPLRNAEKAIADCVTTPNSTRPCMYIGATMSRGMSWVR